MSYDAVVAPSYTLDVMQWGGYKHIVDDRPHTLLGMTIVRVSKGYHAPTSVKDHSCWNLGFSRVL